MEKEQYMKRLCEKLYKLIYWQDGFLGFNAYVYGFYSLGIINRCRLFYRLSDNSILCLPVNYDILQLTEVQVNLYSSELPYNIHYDIIIYLEEEILKRS